ncbi:transcription factor IBH1-like 1 [Wolffia australiana]
MSFEDKLLRYLKAGLQRVDYPSSSTVIERKRAVKLAADAAMALAKGRRRWSLAVIANLHKTKSSHELPQRKKITLQKRVRRTPRAAAIKLARSIVRRRTQVLKRLVPGGDSINDLTELLDEAADYVVSLRAQVDVLRRLVTSVGTRYCPDFKG